MSETIPFGIACFNFGLKKAFPTLRTGNHYIRELRRILESIPNVDNISIEADDGFRFLALDSENTYDSIAQGPNYFPGVEGGLEIRFELYIPARMQTELMPSPHRPSLGTERFRLTMRYGYYSPVTFVEPVAATGNDSPSDAVIIVREFLNKQLSALGSEAIRFEFLGPSPLHARLYLYQLPQPGVEPAYDIEGFACDHLPEKGYSTIEFHFDPALYSDVTQARESLFDELEDEAGLLYRIANANAAQIHEWVALEAAFSRLLSKYQEKGAKGLWGILISAYSQVQDVVVRLAEFEGNQLRIMNDLNREYRSLSGRPRELYLEDLLQTRMTDFPAYPTKQLADVVHLLEDRRSKAVENFIVVIAALLGGVIGALVTLAVTASAG